MTDFRPAKSKAGIYFNDLEYSCSVQAPKGRRDERFLNAIKAARERFFELYKPTSASSKPPEDGCSVSDAMRGDIVDRLRGKYPIGPVLPNGQPEFGWRQHDGLLTKYGIVPAPPIMEEAAKEIEGLRQQLAAARLLNQHLNSFDSNLALQSAIGDQDA